MTDRRYYLDTFKVTETQMGRLVAEALAQGGDYADLYFEYTTYNDLLLRDGEVSSGGFHIDFGVGIRVLKGERTGYAYSENTGMTDMLAAARAAAMIAGGQARKQVERAASGMMGNDAGKTDIGNAGYGGTDSGEGWQDLYPMRQSWRSARAEEFLPFLKSLEQKPLHPRQESDASRMPEADPPAPGFRFNGIVSDGDETFALVSGAGETILVKGNAKIGDYTVIGFSSREMTLDIYGKRITLTL